MGKLSINWIGEEHLDQLTHVKSVWLVGQHILRVEESDVVRYINLNQTKEVYCDLGMEKAGG